MLKVVSLKALCWRGIGMGKRSTFDRIPRDFYPTPEAAVLPLVNHLPSELFLYYEPCVGAGDLYRHISHNCLAFAWGSDISPTSDLPPQLGRTKDALDLTEVDLGDCEYFITNPPWDRKILHPLIEHLSSMRPTWLLFDADWMHTKQSAPFVQYLRKVVSVGRVKWIPDSKMTGKDNCAWHLFDQTGVFEGQTRFFGRATQ